MKNLLIATAAVALATAGIGSAADAATYIGSWRVDQGPSWSTVPTAYTGQAAAALLFGGTASQYSISTVDSNVANINHKAWVSVWFASQFGDCAGYPCGRQVAENAATSTGGLYQNVGDESAYVRDWAVGPQFVNYAFLNGAVPEPASWAMLIAGFGLVGAAARRRRVTVAA